MDARLYDDRLLTSWTRHRSKDNSPSNWGRASYNTDELAQKIFRAKSTKYKGAYNANKTVDLKS